MQLLTVPEAAKELRLHVETVRDLLRSGQLKGSKTSSGVKARWRIDREELKRYTEAK